MGWGVNDSTPEILPKLSVKILGFMRNRSKSRELRQNRFGNVIQCLKFHMLKG